MRAGLVTAAETMEEFPSPRAPASAGQRRWARGDWQLLPWILGRARTPEGGRLRASISAIGRFKMLDNLRRSLSAPAASLLLVAAWAPPGGSPPLWPGFLLAALALPAFLHI